MVGMLPNISSSSITALSSTIASSIASGQALVDPGSVVKELIDNALDARAKSIFVDISTNTIDCIQVKDDGHGIPAEDRPLVCRRHCTSKIRDLDDLKFLGGSWLGFRGEALSSMAEMSGVISIITRVEDEPVAVVLEYDRNGELVTTKRISHPVGTTVKISNFFKYLPVRKETAIKSPWKCLAKIRHLMQTYALARPAIRFRFHVLKEGGNNNGFMYAPKDEANIQDAISKVIGRDCALQCDWTAVEVNGYSIQAFLPKPSAIVSKIANQGAFIAIDARPVSADRGTARRVLTSFRNNLHKFSSFRGRIKNPFIYMNITCPPGCYDINVEPSKDDVVFDDDKLVMGIIDALFETFYNREDTQRNDSAPSNSVQENQESIVEESLNSNPAISASLANSRRREDEDEYSGNPCPHPEWRSSMYGIDADDLEFVKEAPFTIDEQEDECQAASLLNPWTIMQMNTAIKSNKIHPNRQLPRLANTSDTAHVLPSSLNSELASIQSSASGSLAPPKSLRRSCSHSSSQYDSEQDIQHASQGSLPEHIIRVDRRKSTKGEVQTLNRCASKAERFILTSQNSNDHAKSLLPSFSQNSPASSLSPDHTYAFSRRYLPTSLTGSCSVEKRIGFIKKPLKSGYYASNRTPSKQTLYSNQPLWLNRQSKQLKNRNKYGLSFAGSETVAQEDGVVVCPKSFTDNQSFLDNDKNQIRYIPNEFTIDPPSLFSSIQAQRNPRRSSMEKECLPVTGSHRPDSFLGENDINLERQLARNSGCTRENLQRTKSSELPLERVSQDCRIHNTIALVAVSIVSIFEGMRSLDMDISSPIWGRSARLTHSVFLETALEHRVTNWAFTLDTTLHQQHTRLYGVDTRSQLLKGIQRALDTVMTQDSMMNLT